MSEQLSLAEHRTASGRKSRANTGMTEDALLAAVRKLAKYRGWWTYHTHYSRGSEAGWPDLVLLDPRGHRCLFVELKREDGKVTPPQQAWLDALTACGYETGVWRPSDLPTTIPAVLAGRRLTPETTP